MPYHLRQTKREDFEDCLRISQDGFLYASPQRKQELFQMWEEGLHLGYANSGVVEWVEPSMPARVVGFGMSVFPSNEFVEEATNTLQPYLSLQILSMRKMGRSPLLNAREIHKAHLGQEGVNFLGIHFGWDRTLPEKEHLEIQMALLDSLLEHHQGYWFRSYMKEVYGQLERERFVQHFGTPCVRSYPEEIWKSYPSEGVHCEEPYLMFITRQEAYQSLNQGKFVHLFFRAQRPFFKFTDAQRRLLYHAQHCSTDVALAQRLNIKKDTLQNNWEALFIRVQKLETKPPQIRAEDFREGVEQKVRRDIIVNYIKKHPEELCHYVPGKKEL